MKHKKEKIVLAMGYFDFLHIGHLNYLKTAKSMGTYLKVALATDDFKIKENQAMRITPFEQRIQIIESIKYVDEVHQLPSPIANTQASLEWIQKWGVDIVAVGSEWQMSEKWVQLEPLLQQVNISVVFIPMTANISSEKYRQSLK